MYLGGGGVCPPTDADHPLDADPLAADPLGHVTCDTCWEPNTPTLDRMTDACENIILSQTSFADGNKKCVHPPSVAIFILTYFKGLDPGRTWPLTHQHLLILVYTISKNNAVRVNSPTTLIQSDTVNNLQSLDFLLPATTAHLNCKRPDFKRFKNTC